MKLKDICEQVTDRISSEKISLDEYVTTDCILQNKAGRSIAANLPPQKCNLTRYKKGDVLIANIRPYLRKIWFADSDGGCSADVLTFRAKNSHIPEFLYALLMQDSFYDYVMKATKGSKMPRGDINHIMNFPLASDNLNEARIGKLITAIDEKISINRQINRNLEELAKQIYDYWFVQFDFPNEEGKPYKSSGGKMVWNETLKREIPADWEVKSVNDIATSYRGVGYSAKDEKSSKDKNIVLILRGNNISNGHIVYDDNTVYVDKSFVSSEQEIKKYDVIITMSSGSKEHVGKSAMFLFDSPHSYGAFCNKLTPKKNYQFFLANYLHSEYFIKCIRQFASGTGINNLTNQHFSKTIFSFPPNKIISDFNMKVEKIYQQLGIFEQENMKLISLRNSLLPLLMNGQVTLNSCLSHD